MEIYPQKYFNFTARIMFSFLAFHLQI